MGAGSDLDRLRHPPGGDQEAEEEDQQEDVGEDARGGEELDDRGGDDHAGPHPDRRGDAVGEADRDRVTFRMEVEQRGAGGAQREAGREPLDRAGDEEPDDRVGEHEGDRRDDQRRHRDDQDRAPADLVGEPPGEQQGEEHAEGVGRVDQRQDDRVEAPELAVGAVERGGGAGGEQGQADRRRGEQVGGVAGERVAGCGEAGRQHRAAPGSLFPNFWKLGSCTMSAMPSKASVTHSPRTERIRHPEVDSFDLATIMRALGDPVRIEMVRGSTPKARSSAPTSTTRLGLPSSTGSYHLRQLREAGVTRSSAVARAGS